VSFPTTVTRAIESGGFTSHSSVTVDGERYYAGIDVKGENPWFDPRSSDFVGAGPWTAVLVEGLRASKFNPYKAIVVLGLPAQQYDKRGSEEYVQALKRKRIATGNGIPIDFSETEIRFVPQGFGIFLKYISDNHHIDYKSLRIAVVDIGYHTIDFVSLDHGKFINQDARSYPLGISTLFEQVAGEFARRYKCFIPLERAAQFIGNSQIELAGEIYELDTSEIINEYAAQIAMLINNYLERKSVDLGVAGGGGIHVLKKVTKLKRKLAIVRNPENANVIGFWMYGTR